MPFPPEIRSAVVNFKYIAPVVDGGNVVNQINGKSWFGHWRFNIPLLRLYVLNDEKRVARLEAAEGEDFRRDMRTIVRETVVELQRLVR